jgi:hypothetical protein
MMQLSSTATTVSIPLVDGYNLRKAIKTPEQCHVLATTFATKGFLLFPSLKGLPVEVLLKLNARLTANGGFHYDESVKKSRSCCCSGLVCP